jgi:asparagine synthase (glutamine-hydrolysing)
MGFGEDTDELQDARRIAEHFGTDHRELVVDSSQGMRLYPKMIWHMESPKYNLYPWFVCELVRKHVTVCLSGNGGDEVFGGYVARYRNALRIEELSKRRATGVIRVAAGAVADLPGDVRARNRLRVLSHLGDDVAEYLILAGVLPDSFNRKLFMSRSHSWSSLGPYYQPFFQGDGFLDGLMRAELRTKLIDDLLSVDDTMSMAHSLELRVPMLDNRIVDSMSAVRWQGKYDGEVGKLPLRRVMKDILPEESLGKPKWGFSVDVHSWYKGELGELVRQVLPNSEVISRYFSAEMVRRLVERQLSADDRRYEILLWQLLGFHYWHRIFIDSEHPERASLEINALAV